MSVCERVCEKGDIKMRHVSFLSHPLLILKIYHIVGTVHHFYESFRRLFNDQQPGRMEAANRTKEPQADCCTKVSMCSNAIVKLHTMCCKMNFWQGVKLWLMANFG